MGQNRQNIPNTYLDNNGTFKPGLDYFFYIKNEKNFQSDFVQADSYSIKLCYKFCNLLHEIVASLENTVILDPFNFSFLL